MPRPQNPELRDALLTAAIQLLDANGPEFSLRALADSVGYTVTAVYRCYANRSALLTAMQLELFDQLGVALFSSVSTMNKRSQYALECLENSFFHGRCDIQSAINLCSRPRTLKHCVWGGPDARPSTVADVGHFAAARHRTRRTVRP